MVIYCGDVVWANPGEGIGREQGGRRPVVVVSANEYQYAVNSLVLAVPVTARDRGWPNHVHLSGPTALTASSYAMAEQVRSISRDRIVGVAGSIDQECVDRIRVYVRGFLDLW